MKKVLIITYYWPPAGGPGVQRVLKFVKYLPQMGWQPIVLTVRNGEYPALDYTLEADIPAECTVYKTPSLEPGAVYKRFVGMDRNAPIPNAVVTEKDVSWKKRLANFIRLNLFIPDAKILWKPLAVSHAKRLIRREKPDLILSSSPPPTVHLIARKLARWSGLPWVADFRDPWTDMYYFSAVHKWPHTRLIERRMEKSVLAGAHVVTTVSRNLKELFDDKTDGRQIIHIIPNGYDVDDLPPAPKKQSQKFTIAYGGKLGPQQNPQALWKALGTLLQEEPGFAKNAELLFMGKFSPEVRQSISRAGLDSILNDLGYVDHKTLLQNLSSADMLLLVIPDSRDNAGILTGKVFEYFGLRRFILGMGPEEGDVADILNETGCGRMVDFNQSPLEIIRHRFRQREQALLQVQEEAVQQYDRRRQTRQLTDIFETLIKKA